MGWIISFVVWGKLFQNPNKVEVSQCLCSNVFNAWLNVVVSSQMLWTDLPGTINMLSVGQDTSISKYVASLIISKIDCVFFPSRPPSQPVSPHRSCWDRSSSTPPVPHTSTSCSWPSLLRAPPPLSMFLMVAWSAWPPYWDPPRAVGEEEEGSEMASSTNRTCSPTSSCASCCFCWCWSLSSSSTVSCGTLSSPPCRTTGHWERPERHTSSLQGWDFRALLDHGLVLHMKLLPFSFHLDTGLCG